MKAPRANEEDELPHLMEIVPNLEESALCSLPDEETRVPTVSISQGARMRRMRHRSQS